MDKPQRRKHKAHKRSLVVGNQHRPFFEATAGGKKSLGKLGAAVDTEAARISDQESSRSQQQQAAERIDEARRILTKGLRHVATVSTLVRVDGAPTFAGSRPPNDEQLIGRLDAVLAGTSAHADALVNEGVQPALLATLASELAAFKKAKETITLSGKLYTEASAALDDALSEGDDAIAVLEGILETSPDAPAGALTALRQAKLIGPREIADGEPAASTVPAPAGPTPAPTPPAEPPVTEVLNKVA